MSRESMTQVYFNRRMVVLLGLGFASGLPSQWRMLGSTVQSWLTDYEIDIATIGLFGLVGVPFLFNFAWAPLLDSVKPPAGLHVFGRRRGWLLLIQAALLIAVAVMGVCGPTSGDDALLPFAAAALIVALFAATQDVVADAYRTDILEDEELGVGAAVFVNGYRFAMLAAGGGAIFLSKYLPWSAVYVLLAGLMFVGLAATLLAKPAPVQATPASLYEAVVEPAEDFFLRKGTRGLAVLAFVVLFKLPDNLANAMTIPLLQGGLGIDKAEIAWVREGLGLAIFVISTMAGGGVLAKLGVYRALWLFGILQAVSNLGFMVLAMLKTSSVAALTVVVVIENVCAGFVVAGFVAFLMSQCNRRYSATQYALFTSLMAGGALMTSAVSGYLVKALDESFAAFFFLSAVAAAPGLMLLAVLGPTIGRSDEAHHDAVERRSALKVLGVLGFIIGLVIFSVGLSALPALIDDAALRAAYDWITTSVIDLPELDAKQLRKAFVYLVRTVGGVITAAGAIAWACEELRLRIKAANSIES